MPDQAGSRTHNFGVTAGHDLSGECSVPQQPANPLAAVLRGRPLGCRWGRSDSHVLAVCKWRVLPTATIPI
jgi:hypothetical protein